MKQFFDVAFKARALVRDRYRTVTKSITIYCEGIECEAFALATVARLHPDGAIQSISSSERLYPDSYIYGLYPEEAMELYDKYLEEYEEASREAACAKSAMNALCRAAISRWDAEFGIEFPVVAGGFLVEMDTEDGTVTIKRVNQLGVKKEDQ